MSTRLSPPKHQQSDKDSVVRDALYRRIDEATCDETGWPPGVRTRHVNGIVKTVREIKGKATRVYA